MDKVTIEDIIKLQNALPEKQTIPLNDLTVIPMPSIPDNVIVVSEKLFEELQLFVKLKK